MPSVLFETVKETLFQHSNIFRPCPQNGTLWIKDYTLDGSVLPKVFLPAGSYYISVENFSNGTRYVHGKVYFIVPEGKTIEDDRMG